MHSAPGTQTKEAMKCEGFKKFDIKYDTQYAYTKEDAKSLDAIFLKVLYMWKHGKAPKVGQNKPQLLSSWNAEKNNPIEYNKPWIT